jgi:hypothetical protein
MRQCQRVPNLNDSDVLREIAPMLKAEAGTFYSALIRTFFRVP